MCLQGFGLGDGTGHTVQDITAGAVGLGQPLLNDADDDLVGNQLAGIHIGLGLQADGRTGLDGGTEDVTGGNGRDVQLTGEDLGLGAFAGARWP